MHSKVRFSLSSLFVAGSLMAVVATGCGDAGSGAAAGSPGSTGAAGSPGADGTSGSSGTPFIKVTPAQLGIWKLLGANTATATIAADKAWPVSSLGGTGSVRLLTGSGSGSGGDWPAWAGSGGKAFVGTTVLNTLGLTDLTALSYNAYNAGTVTLMPYLSVFVDLDGDGVFDKTKDDILTFDPSYFPATAQAAVASDRWQNWDALSTTAKSWRCVFGKAKVNASGAACTPNTAYGWNDLASSNPTAKVVPASCQEVPFPVASAQNTCATADATAPGLLFTVGQKSGDQWANYTGYLDDVQLGVQGFNQTYNFEVQ